MDIGYVWIYHGYLQWISFLDKSQNIQNYQKISKQYPFISLDILSYPWISIDIQIG